MLLHHTADTKKRRRWKGEQMASSCSSSRSCAAAAQCQCCCYAGTAAGGGQVATLPLSRCSGAAASAAPSASSPAHAAARRCLDTSAHRLVRVILVLLAAAASSRGVLPPLGAAAAVSPAKMARIQTHLDTINKAAVRSIQSADGDTIDCVPRHKQRALDHPRLRNHAVQTAPPRVPTPRAAAAAAAATMAATAASSNRTSIGGGGGGRRAGAWQTWHHGGHCPRGTVAVRRATAEDVLRAGSVARFGRKDGRRQRLYRAARAADAPDIVSGNGHEHAIAYTAAGGEVYGAKATINVWDPAIQESNGFSLSQLWVLSGSFNGSDLNSIEAGWQVSPELYGDRRPRLFTYWTSDAYEATGCYNALCPGFVQTSSRIAIGASISPVSSPGGAQYDMTVLVWKDPKLGNWWLSYGGQLVGYWPAELFTHLADRATMVEWGGEVVNTSPGGVHTATQMGSGRFAGDGFGRASYFRNLETVDADNSLAEVPFDAVQTLAEDPGCYDIRKAYDGGHSSSSGGGGGGGGPGGGWGTHFYYGGPGHNPACP